jgi:hypothetical protein
MKSSALFASVVLLVASTAVMASERDHDKDHDRERSSRPSSTQMYTAPVSRTTPALQPSPALHTGTAMRPVFNQAGPGDQAHGWRYYSDPAALRAVVISPQGDYYLNSGEGLRKMTRTGA